MNFPNEGFINYLASYGAGAGNQSSFDEHVSKKIKRCKTTPITLENRYFEEIKDLLQHPEPMVILIAGAAGDGKSYLCRQLWQSVGGEEKEWQKADNRAEYDNHGLPLVFIKDLSAIPTGDESDGLIREIMAVIRGKAQQCFVVAANDGQIIEKLKRYRNTLKQKEHTEDAERVMQVISGIESFFLEHKELNLAEVNNFHIYDLRLLCDAALAEKAIDNVVNHPDWIKCGECELQQQCVIYQNRNFLKEDGVFKQRLLELITLNICNGSHITIRNLLLLISNIILGVTDRLRKNNSSKSSGIMSCKIAAALIDEDCCEASSIFDNVFGYNLTSQTREKYLIFSDLCKLNVGIESNRDIDNLLIYNINSEDLYNNKQNKTYSRILKLFVDERNRYLNGLDINKDTSVSDKFYELLNIRRRMLFFTTSNEDSKNYKIWDLTIYRYGYLYLKLLHNVHEYEEIEETSAEEIKNLILGLNILFTGNYLVNNDDEDAKLYVAYSTGYSNDDIYPICPKENCIEYGYGVVYYTVACSNDNKKLPIIKINFSKNALEPLSLVLTPQRYEFILRIASGSLTTSFANECLQDIQAFKAALLSALENSSNQRRKQTQLNVFEVDDSGHGQIKPIKFKPAALPEESSFFRPASNITGKQADTTKPLSNICENIWGHRLLAQQTPQFVLLEFLTILLYRYQLIKNQHDENTSLFTFVKDEKSQKDIIFYTAESHIRLRSLIFNNPYLEYYYHKLQDNLIDKDKVWDKWEEQFRKPDSNLSRHDDLSYLRDLFSNFSDFVNVIKLLRSSAFYAAENKRWSSKFIFPYGENSIYKDINTKGEIDRNLFGRSGEILYLMLAHAEKCDDLSKLLTERFFYQKSVLSVLDDIAQGLQHGHANKADSVVKSGYLAVNKHHVFNLLCEDWIAILNCKIPIQDTWYYLYHISGLHMIRYFLLRGNDFVLDRRSTDIPCEIISTKRTKIRRLAGDRFIQNDTLGQIALGNYIDRLIAEYHDLPDNGRKTEAEYIKDKINYSGSDDDDVQKIKNACIEYYKKKTLNMHRLYGKEIGLISAVSSRRLRYIISDVLIKTLVIANVKDRMLTSEFLDLLYQRYEIIIGQREGADYIKEGNYESADFVANLNAFETRLFSLGMLIKLSDSCSYVINPYNQFN